jgi:hypothetical protein
MEAIWRICQRIYLVARSFMSLEAYIRKYTAPEPKRKTFFFPKSTRKNQLSRLSAFVVLLDRTLEYNTRFSCSNVFRYKRWGDSIWFQGNERFSPNRNGGYFYTQDSWVFISDPIIPPRRK